MFLLGFVFVYVSALGKGIGVWKVNNFNFLLTFPLNREIINSVESVTNKLSSPPPIAAGFIAPLLILLKVTP